MTDADLPDPGDSPGPFDWERPEGGVTAIRLPARDARALAQVWLRHGVAIVPGSGASVDGRFSDRVRVTLGNGSQLEEETARLGRAWPVYHTDAGSPPRDPVAAIV